MAPTSVDSRTSSGRGKRERDLGDSRSHRDSRNSRSFRDSRDHRNFRAAGRDSKRFRPNHGSSSPAAPIPSRSAPIDEAIRRSAPSLHELRDTNASSRSWQWDRAPRGYEGLNVHTLKLFGLATPNFYPSPVPQEVTKMQRVKPLVASASWLVRVVGSRIWESELAAAEAIANGLGLRPVGLKEALAKDATKATPVLTDPTALVVRDAVSTSEAASRYNDKVVDSSDLGTDTFAVKFEHATPPKDADVLLFSEAPRSTPVVEILNAHPLAGSTNGALVEEAIARLCSQLGADVKKVWTSGSTFPYKLLRVFVELQDPTATENIAAQLGGKTLEGRPLITTLNYTEALQK